MQDVWSLHVIDVTYSCNKKELLSHNQFELFQLPYMFTSTDVLASISAYEKSCMDKTTKNKYLQKLRKFST